MWALINKSESRTLELSKIYVLQIKRTIFSYGSVIACYLMHKEIYTHVVVYEEMISTIIAGTKTLFEKLDFPSDYVPETLTG